MVYGNFDDFFDKGWRNDSFEYFLLSNLLVYCKNGIEKCLVIFFKRKKFYGFVL